MITVHVERLTRVFNSRDLYFVRADLIYTFIGFGVIDRGTNVLQIRPTTLCPLNCIFCSVDAGPYSKSRVSEFIVSKDSIINTVIEIGRYKNCGGIEALIDTVGEGLTYPWIFDLIKNLKSIPFISSTAMETHGALLNEGIVRKLEESGLDRINLSIETLNPSKARLIQGVEWFNVEKVKKIAEFIVRETSIDLHVTPVWIPGLNDEDVVQVVEWAYRIGAGKKWPPATIQKYIVHKHGRKIPGVRELSWSEFWKWIERFEEKYGLRVSWSMNEWFMFKTRKYPCPYQENQLITVKILAPGLFKSEYIGYDLGKKLGVTVVGSRLIIGEIYFAEVIHVKDCIVIARALNTVK